MARPSLLTVAKIAEIEAALETHMTVVRAAAACGVGRSTVNTWLAEGRIHETEGADSLNRELLAAVERARSVVAAKHLANIAEHAANGAWQASAWLLERTMPDDFSMKQRVDVADVTEDRAFDLTPEQEAKARAFTASVSGYDATE